jgi:hypothetical protein
VLGLALGFAGLLAFAIGAFVRGRLRSE